MTAAPDTTNRRKWPTVGVSAACVLIAVGAAVFRGGTVPWVRWTAIAVAILIAIGLVVLTRKYLPRPAGYDGKDTQTQFVRGIVGMSSFILTGVLGSAWQGNAPLLVLAGVLGSIPILALMWWKVLRPNRTTDTGRSPR